MASSCGCISCRRWQHDDQIRGRAVRQQHARGVRRACLEQTPECGGRAAKKPYRSPITQHRAPAPSTQHQARAPRARAVLDESVEHQAQHRAAPSQPHRAQHRAPTQQQHRAPKHRAGAAPSTQHQARAPSTQLWGAYAITERFSSRTAYPVSSEVYPHFGILCLPGISLVCQSSWYLISHLGPTICVRCGSEARVDGGGQMQPQPFSPPYVGAR